MSAVGNFDFNDSRVAFLHGMIPAKRKLIDQTPGGTCTSMPVMYVAVGRRLGYPLKLVTTNSHIFARWDGADHPNPAWRERFNIEGSGRGFSSYDDDHYKSWPLKTTDYEVRFNRYLISLTPAEELAQFLAARGHCAIDNKRLHHAALCYETAYRYDPSRPCYRAWFTKAAMRCGYRPSTPALMSRHHHAIKEKRGVIRYHWNDKARYKKELADAYGPKGRITEKRKRMQDRLSKSGKDRVYYASKNKIFIPMDKYYDNEDFIRIVKHNRSLKKNLDRTPAQQKIHDELLQAKIEVRRSERPQYGMWASDSAP